MHGCLYLSHICRKGKMMSEKICDKCFHSHFLFDYCSKGYKVGDRSTCDEFTDKKEKEKYLKNDYKMGRCNPCPYAEEMSGSGGWCFLGCFHKPYNGKWVVEIKDCPKEREDDEIN